MRFLALTTVFIALFCISGCGSQTAQPNDDGASVYDQQLAEKLGADDYGMAQYVFVTLKTGPKDAEITDEATRNALFAGHFANMGRLAEEGKLVLAGPFMDAAPKRGLFIFDVPTIEEARELVASDPAIKAGVFVVEFDKYYGSAAVRQINDIHSRIQQTQIE